MTKDGLKKPNYWGSLTHASTCRVGNYRGEEAYAPFSALLPMVHPNDIVWGGWDISSLNLADAMERAQVCCIGVLYQPLALQCAAVAGAHLVSCGARARQCACTCSEQQCPIDLLTRLLLAGGLVGCPSSGA